MSGFAQMVVFDTAGTIATLLVLVTAPDGPRRRRKGKR